MNRKFPQLSRRCSPQIITKISNLSDFGSRTNSNTSIESHCVSEEVTNPPSEHRRVLSPVSPPSVRVLRLLTAAFGHL
jgi:hypothetical protein